MQRAIAPRIWLLALLLMVPACSITTPVQFPAGTRAVFAGHRALDLTRPCSRQDPGETSTPGYIGGTWTPTERQLDLLERSLPDEFKRNLLPTDTLSVSDYYRQYGGLVIGDRRIIYVNAFDRRVLDHWRPRDPSSTWRDVPVAICHGGMRFFGVEFEPSTGLFKNFQFSVGGPPSRPATQ